jgi:polyisoprenoid-binding protein YceI
MSTTEQTQTLPTGTWRTDPVHSDLQFSVDYMSGTFRGTFSTFGAELADGGLEGWAEVSSVQVKDPNLEAHLQSPEFFDAERHPRLTVVSREITRSGNDVTIRGDVTIKGQTHPITITGTISDPIADPFGNERFGLRLEGTLDRTEFGVTWNNPLPSGEPALDNQVRVSADFQFVKAS